MDTNRIPKQALQYKQKDEGTQNRGSDFWILRIKVQERRIILHEHGDDDVLFCLKS
jgi:hypothetical protein